MLAELAWGAAMYLAGIATAAGGAYAVVTRARRRLTKTAATIPFDFSRYTVDKD